MSLSIARECGAKVKAYAEETEYSFTASQLAAYESRIRADQRERDAALRVAVRQMTLALQNREWADLLSTDADVTALESEIRELLERIKR